MLKTFKLKSNFEAFTVGLSLNAPADLACRAAGLHSGPYPNGLILLSLSDLMAVTCTLYS